MMQSALCMAIGLAVIVGSVPVSFAQDSRSSDRGKSAGTHQGLGNNTGISIDVPMGKISVDPQSLDGEPIYVRRTTGKEGVTILEVSTTPFMPVLASNEQTAEVARWAAKPDQPAGW